MITRFVKRLFLGVMMSTCLSFLLLLIYAYLFDVKSPHNGYYQIGLEAIVLGTIMGASMFLLSGFMYGYKEKP